MRPPTADAGELVELVGTINDIVRNVVSVSRKAFSTPAGSTYRADGEELLQDLERSNEHLEGLREMLPLEGRVTAGGRPGKRPMAEASFEVAKLMKELMHMISD